MKMVFFAVPENAAIPAISIEPANVDADDGSSEWTRTFTSKVSLPSASTFGHAGAYKYIVGETTSGGSSLDNTKWSNSKATYVLTVYIQNDGEDALSYKNWIVERLKTHQGDIVDTSQSDPKVNAVYNVSTNPISGVLFESDYIGYQNLTITEQTTGSLANKLWAFPVSVTLILPDWYASTNASASPVMYANGGEAGTPVYNSEYETYVVTITNNMSDGQSKTFSVPVGTRYRIEESNNRDSGGREYNVSIAW